MRPSLGVSGNLTCRLTTDYAPYATLWLPQLKLHFQLTYLLGPLITRLVGRRSKISDNEEGAGAATELKRGQGLLPRSHRDFPTPSLLPHPWKGEGGVGRGGWRLMRREAPGRQTGKRGERWACGLYSLYNQLSVIKFISSLLLSSSSSSLYIELWVEREREREMVWVAV